MNDIIKTLGAPFRGILDPLPAPIRAGVVTATFSFLSLFAVSAAGWLQDLSDALATGDPLPSLSILASAALSAATSVLIGAVNTVVRAIQSWQGYGQLPDYGQGD